LKVLYVYADTPNELNCSKHNCLFPAEAINRLDEHSAKTITMNDFIKNSKETQQLCGEADILIIERNFFSDTLTIMQFWRSRGKKIVAIFDDAYDIISKDNPAYYFWKLNQKKMPVDSIAQRIATTFKQSNRNDDKLWNNIPVEEREPLAKEALKILTDKIPLKINIMESKLPNITQFIWGLKMVNAVQVPSKMLKLDWKKYNKNIYHINNYIETEKYLNVAPLHPHNGIIIGWQGSLSHFASFKESGVLAALKSICNKYPQVKVMIGGDKKVFDAVDLPNDKKMYHNYVPEQQWPSLLKTFDIAIAPLATEYDKRRSWVKVLEYLALKIPWAATRFPTYDSLIAHGELVINSEGNWTRTLSDMVENINIYKNKANGTPYQFALNQSYDKNIEKTLEIYQKIIDMPYKP